MTTHELARRLLEEANLPCLINRHDDMDSWTEEVEWVAISSREIVLETTKPCVFAPDTSYSWYAENPAKERFSRTPFLDALINNLPMPTTYY